MPSTFRTVLAIFTAICFVSVGRASATSVEYEGQSYSVVKIDDLIRQRRNFLDKGILESDSALISGKRIATVGYFDYVRFIYFENSIDLRIPGGALWHDGINVVGMEKFFESVPVVRLAFRWLSFPPARAGYDFLNKCYDGCIVSVLGQIRKNSWSSYDRDDIGTEMIINEIKFVKQGSLQLTFDDVLYAGGILGDILGGDMDTVPLSTK
jgi:hypothetical protein